ATASQVLDLLADDAVRRRFGFDDDDLAQLTRWVGDSGIRWGLTSAHRAPFGLGTLEQNTWRAGLDRVLVGVAMAEDQVLLGRTLPLDDVGSGSIDLAGRFAEAVERVQRAVEDLQRARYAGEWVQALGAGVSSLTALDRDDAWQSVQLDRELASIGTGADGQ